MALTELDKTINTLCDRVQKLLARHAAYPRERVLIALAGVPGSGKTTVSSAVMERLRSRGVNRVMVTPMDGFHYSQEVLSTLPDPDLAFRRRGAPFTFDAAGVVNLVRLLRETPVTTPEEPEIIIHAPSFDHALKDPVLDDLAISSRTRLIIVEGNYTLLDAEPWREISDLVDERWFVDIDPDTARDRLVQRHLLAGIESTQELALARVEANDLPNGNLIRERSFKPDVRIPNSESFS